MVSALFYASGIGHRINSTTDIIYMRYWIGDNPVNFAQFLDRRMPLPLSLVDIYLGALAWLLTGRSGQYVR